MKKPRLDKGDPDMRAEYDFRGAERGRLARRFGWKVGVLLDPDVAKHFPDSKSVNDLLRAIVRAFPAPERPAGGRGKSAHR